MNDSMGIAVRVPFNLGVYSPSTTDGCTPHPTTPVYYPVWSGRVPFWHEGPAYMVAVLPANSVGYTLHPVAT